MNIFEIILKYRRELGQGLFVTFQLCVVTFPLSLIFGASIGLLRYKYPKIIGLVLNILSIIVSSTPIIVFLFWMHYPFQYIFNLVINPFVTSVIVLTTISAFVISDYISNALKNFSVELLNTAQVCGFSNDDIIRKIQFPIIFRQLLPNIIMTFNFILQSSLFCSFIAVEEVFKRVQQINAEIFKPIELYSAVAIFFITVCLIINLISSILKKKYDFNLSQY